jgi:hypothetical protein
MTACVGACGDDDDDSPQGGDSAAAEAPAPARAFGGLATALEPSGYDVSTLPKASLNGAEAGVEITGDKTGTGREFTTEAKAKDYADEVAETGGDKTTTVGTVVFQASTQDDADFFADAYEGG